MKRTITRLTAALGMCLLLAAGSATAEPGEPCAFDGQTGYSYEEVRGLNGWHLWECSGGSWRYVTYCGVSFCIV